MDPHRTSDHPALDAALDATAPLIADSPEAARELDAQVTAMLAEVARVHPRTAPGAGEAGPSGRRRRGRGARIVAGLGVSVALGGVGAAAAASLGGWTWDDPDFAVTYVGPDGRTCEMRFGQVETDNLSDPDRDPATRELDPELADWMKATDVLALADIEGALAQVEKGQSVWEISVGAPPGTKGTYEVEVDEESGEFEVSGMEADGLMRPAELTPAEQYEHAVAVAVGEVIEAEAASRGITAFAYARATQCGEAAR